MTIKVNKNIFLFGLFGLFIIVGVIFTIILNPGEDIANGTTDINNTNRFSSISSNSLGSDTNLGTQKTATMGAVTVDVEPKTLGLSEENNIFSISFNTHSVELDFDFTGIIILEDNLKNSYKALEWTGNSGWHHVSGDIIFPSINKQASKVTLIINGIEGLTQKFDWDIK